MFHYRDGQAPQTPEPEPQPEQLQPPPPPRQMLKVRRRRTTVVAPDAMADALKQQPIPTIETQDFASDASTDLPAYPSVQNEAFLSPGMGYMRMHSPPKTPAAQVRTVSHYDGPQDWSDLGRRSYSASSSRPTSSSGFSDSSVSSCDSIGSFMSRGGSCTSPEEEMTDPFDFCSPPTQFSNPTSPFLVQQARPANKLKLRATFSEDMDHHLWMTYMKYLQDPTVTPFKALPSTVPPNGVCHRVARMARKTWKGPRPSRLGQHTSRNDTPDTVRALKSGSNTPLARASKSFLRFPTEKQCRKRLRDLAKQKPTLSAHYQRLLHRSPSPFQSSPPKEPSSTSAEQRPLPSPFSQGSTSFSTRDMNVSLATSTAASMQAGNPLSRLASNATPRPTARTWSSARSSAHQKSQSLHIGLGLGLGNVLGSPFRSTAQVDVFTDGNNARTWHAASSSTQPARLGSPFQLHAPRPRSRVFKRRALNNSFDDKNRGRGESFVSELFGAPAESSHRRVRSRGFSLGDMIDGARRLPFANEPSGVNPFLNPSPAATSPVQRSPVVTELRGQATVRLGSPFGGQSSNTFPRATISHSFEPPASFEERFAAAPSDPSYLDRY